MNGQTVLLIGSGAREHAMAWKLAQSPRIAKLIVAPGGDGMTGPWERWADVSLSGGPETFGNLATRARDARVDLVIVGPDNPLAEGIVDLLEGRGLRCFGPTASAARIEASKAFAKDVMRAAGVPTAPSVTVHSLEGARAFLDAADWSVGWVLKADGLAFGKGVVVCSTREQARNGLESLHALGPAASTLIIEERLAGQEISWHAFCDGDRCSLLQPARDYKRVGTGDQGGNTGGMGSISPVPGIPDAWYERVRREIFLPTLRELKRRGAPFRGVLYAGLMIDPARDTIRVIEFNARFGDPEAQVLLARMSDDLWMWCDAVAGGSLSLLPERVSFHHESAVYVVAAAKGYPEKPEKGAPISGLLPAGEPARRPHYFAAGVARKPSPTGDVLVTSGGRVLGALGMGRDLGSARTQAYERMGRVSFEGMHFRADIGLREVDAE